MKNKKPHKLYNEKKDIIEWLKSNNINNFSLIPDDYYGFVVRVDGNVVLAYKNLEEIKVKFCYIDGYFTCNYNNLKTLYGCPDTVRDWFDCSNNKLKTLDFCPLEVGEEFNCSSNQLINISGINSNEGYFNFSYNQIETFEDFPKIKNVKLINASNNKIKTLKGIPEIIEQELDVSNNLLRDLKNCPKEINGECDFSHNRLNNLMYLPENVAGVFLIKGNPRLNALQEIKYFQKLKEECYKLKMIMDNKERLDEIIPSNDKLDNKKNKI